MALNLSGKFWKINELEKKFNFPAYALYPILNSLTGVIKIGQSYLVPDYLLQTLKERLMGKETYSINTVARLTHCNPGTIRLLIANGLPYEIFGIDQPRINKKYIPALKIAIEETRNKEFANKTSLAMEIVRLVKMKMATQKGEGHVQESREEKSQTEVGAIRHKRSG